MGSVDQSNIIATPSVNEASAFQVYVAFKYDLGGNVVDHRKCREVLANVCGGVEEDEALARSWNLSYLVRHAVVLRGSLGSGIATLGGSEWRFRRSLRLYPWLGVVSIDYMFDTDDKDPQLHLFYDDLVTWKNADYLPYLTACGAMTPELAAHTASTQGAPQDLHGGTVRLLRRQLHRHIDPRPVAYAFHDFRTVFLDLRSSLNPRATQGLLLLSRSAPSEGFVAPEMMAGQVQALSTGWATVLRGRADVSPAAFAQAISMLSLVHAQWYLCQAWISVYDYDVVRLPRRQAYELSSAQVALRRDLTEVGNMDLMLKDPDLLRVARFFEQVFDVANHLITAERRLRVLEEFSRGLADFRQTRATNRLQVLFALSAAGSIAALIPALVQINFPPVVSAITALTVVVLWLGFALIARQGSKTHQRRTRSQGRPTSDDHTEG